eukprot:scaffold175190_cov12-Tisochrysis_lutea.AAC.1
MSIFCCAFGVRASELILCQKLCLCALGGSKHDCTCMFAQLLSRYQPVAQFHLSCKRESHAAFKEVPCNKL